MSWRPFKMFNVKLFTELQSFGTFIKTPTHYFGLCLKLASQQYTRMLLYKQQVMAYVRMQCRQGLAFCIYTGVFESMCVILCLGSSECVLFCSDAGLVSSRLVLRSVPLCSLVVSREAACVLGL